MHAQVFLVGSFIKCFVIVFIEVPATAKESRERGSTRLVSGGRDLLPGAGHPEPAPSLPGAAAPPTRTMGPAAESRGRLLRSGKGKITTDHFLFQYINPAQEFST
jgi:hypothetical protein